MANPNETKVLIVDDEQTARRFAECALQHAGFVCSAVAGVAEAKEMLTVNTYDLLLTDLHLTDGTGTQLLRWVAEQDLLVPVVVITGYPTVASAVDAFRLDAVDYLVKPCDNLGKAVAAALARYQKRWATNKRRNEWANSLRQVADWLEQDIERPGQSRAHWASQHPAWQTLSPRERQVAQSLVGGDTVRAIAAELRISENTVRNHLKATYRKFYVSSQSELMRKIFSS
ncbi:MAG: response regulator [Myxococcales bacterium]|nr:response regulator [Myxococcales bacterium]